MANNDRLKQIISNVQLLNELVDSMIDSDMYPVFFFSQAYDLIQKLQSDFHTLEADQVEMFAEQLKKHQALILSIHQQMRHFSAQTESIIHTVTLQAQRENVQKLLLETTTDDSTVVIPSETSATPSPEQPITLPEPPTVSPALPVTPPELPVTPPAPPDHSTLPTHPEQPPVIPVQIQDSVLSTAKTNVVENPDIPEITLPSTDSSNTELIEQNYYKANKTSFLSRLGFSQTKNIPVETPIEPQIRPLPPDRPKRPMPSDIPVKPQTRPLPPEIPVTLPPVQLMPADTPVKPQMRPLPPEMPIQRPPVKPIPGDTLVKPQMKPTPPEMSLTHSPVKSMPADTPVKPQIKPAQSEIPLTRQVKQMPPQALVAPKQRPVAPQPTTKPNPATTGIPTFLAPLGSSHEHYATEAMLHPTVNDAIEKKKLTDLRKAFSINDRFRYRKELFKGNEDTMNKVISILNTKQTFKESIQFLEKLHWDFSDPVVKDFTKILEIRFL